MNEQEKIEAYLSSVRHDLRSQLVVIREGTSMILEGIGNENCDNCFALLKPSLECTDELNRLIGDLLSVSRFNDLSAAPRPAKEEEPVSGKKELLENELEKFEMKLLGMISHEIRTPLTVIKEGLSLVIDEIPGPLNAKQKELLSAGRQNVDVLIQSVEEILEKSWNEIGHPARAPSPDEAIAGKEKAPPKKRILIVEDQAMIVNMLKMRLEANGYEVITAGDGQEGLEKAHQENPNLIILDIMLPKMNGYKVCQLLKADPKYKTIPIIISSGRTPPEIRKMSKEVGADAYVNKPFQAETLLSTMKELLEKKGK
jgi:twitching motility two-component system response regulator PilH